MIGDAILALGLVMAYATQLSMPGMPIGLTEFFLSIWIVLSLGKVVIGNRLELSPAFTRIGIFWLVLVLLLSFATIVGYFTTTLSLPDVLHDTTAYLLLILFTCLAASEEGAEARLRRVAWWILVVANTSFLIQIGLAWGWFHQSGVDPWYWDRFRGWSENPNQLALYCAIFGPLALHLATTTKLPMAKLLALAALFLSFYVGRLTKSDTFLYATVLTCLIFLALRARSWIADVDAGRSLRRQIAAVLVVATPTFIVALTPYGIQEIGAAEKFAKSLTKDRGGEGTVETAELRLFLWDEALQKGMKSFSLGLGPGPHLEQPAITQKTYPPVPFEAHNTFLDLYTQGGLVLVLAYCWIMAAAVLQAWRSKHDALLVLIVSITIFSVPHLIVRHPIVWFCVILTLATGMGAAVKAQTPSAGASRCVA